MRERDTRILVGALNWLMLQYESDLSDTHRVRRIITKVLTDYEPNMSDTHLFRELYLDKDEGEV